MRGIINLNNKNAQVWIETMIYTLIGFALIAAVLAFAKPKIEQMQDKAVIDQSMQILESMNAEILSVIQGGPGNKRIITIGIKKGELVINPLNDEINFLINTKLKYSELDKEIPIGSVFVKTIKSGSANQVILKSNYTTDFSGYDLKYAKSDDVKTLSKSSTPYKLSISNEGNGEAGGDFIINMEVVN